MMKIKYTVIYEEAGDFIQDEETGEYLNIEEACAMLNDYYEDKAKLSAFFKTIQKGMNE